MIFDVKQGRLENDGDRITLDYFEESGLVFRPIDK